VIGAGRLGASLALALRAQGATLLGFTAHSHAGRIRAESWLGGRASTDIAELVSYLPDLYVIAVPDQAVSAVAAQLGTHLARAADFNPAATGIAVPVVAHTSGATSVTVLLPCERVGASTLVFHPLQTFSDPLTAPTHFAGAAIAITPSADMRTSPAATLGFALANTLGGRPFLLPDNKRSLYHAAATFACNYLVTLEHHAEQLFLKAGLPDEEPLALFLPLVRATLDNLSARGTVDALTGPLSRGDSHTIANHLTALAADAPHLLAVYRALGLATLDLVRARDEVSPSIITELADLLEDPSQLSKLERNEQEER
jgi:predicted short-subunit dehydrogenase-like oxidoreductase (DUF2520 family)